MYKSRSCSRHQSNPLHKHGGAGAAETGDAEDVQADTSDYEDAWINNPERHFILQLGETGGRHWRTLETAVRSVINKRKIPSSNVYGEYYNTHPSSIFQLPTGSSFSSLTKKDRLDLCIHGTRLGPLDGGNAEHAPVNYTARLVAERLSQYGLKEVGVLRLDSCNVGIGVYLQQLKSALTEKGIKCGFICAPNGVLQSRHLPIIGKRPVFRAKFWEPWNVTKGNMEVRFPGTKYDF